MKINNFSSSPSMYWKEETKLSFLQRKIILYSVMYYEMNESCISDRDYDILSKQYIKMSKTANQSSLERTDYYYCMYDFDGTTGFDIPDRLKKKDKKRIYQIINAIKVSKMFR